MTNLFVGFLGGLLQLWGVSFLWVLCILLEHLSNALPRVVACQNMS